MFLRRGKPRFEVDLGALEDDEKEQLFDFLNSSLKDDAVSSGSKVVVDSDRSSLDELKRLVTKFVYHRNLNRKYWVAVEGNVVRLRKFEKAKKQEKRKRETTPPTTISHGW